MSRKDKKMEITTSITKWMWLCKKKKQEERECQSGQNNEKK